MLFVRPCSEPITFIHKAIWNMSGQFDEAYSCPSFHLCSFPTFIFLQEYSNFMLWSNGFLYSYICLHYVSQQNFILNLNKNLYWFKNQLNCYKQYSRILCYLCLELRLKLKWINTMATRQTPWPPRGSGRRSLPSPSYPRGWKIIACKTNICTTVTYGWAMFTFLNDAMFPNS